MQQLLCQMAVQCGGVFNDIGVSCVCIASTSHIFANRLPQNDRRWADAIRRRHQRCPVAAAPISHASRYLLLCEAMESNAETQPLSASSSKGVVGGPYVPTTACRLPAAAAGQVRQLP